MWFRKKDLICDDKREKSFHLLASPGLQTPLSLRTLLNLTSAICAYLSLDLLEQIQKKILECLKWDRESKVTISSFFLSLEFKLQKICQGKKEKERREGSLSRWCRFCCHRMYPVPFSNKLVLYSLKIVVWPFTFQLYCLWTTPAILWKKILHCFSSFIPSSLSTSSNWKVHLINILLTYSAQNNWFE